MDQSTLLAIALVVAIGVAYMYMRRGDRLQARLTELKGKPELDQALELATTEQLFKQLVVRNTEVILIMREPTNGQPGMSIFVAGMPIPVAIMHMTAASVSLMTNPVTSHPVAPGKEDDKG